MRHNLFLIQMGKVRCGEKLYERVAVPTETNAEKNWSVKKEVFTMYLCSDQIG